MHFQAYLLEGIVRWNAARTIAAIDSNSRNLRSFNQKLSKKLQNLQLEVFQKPKDLAFQQAAAYTDELFGIKYLYGNWIDWNPGNKPRYGNRRRAWRRGCPDNWCSWWRYFWTLNSMLLASSFISAESEDAHFDSSDSDNDNKFSYFKSIGGGTK